VGRLITLTGPTAADVRDIMVEGESGLLAVCDRAGIRYRYVPSKRRIYFPDYGGRALMISADRPDRYRGVQSDTIWADELAAWRYADDAWTQLMLGMRIGTDPRAAATTTPRPSRFLKALIADASTVVTWGTTYQNLENLHQRFKEQVIKRYEGTNLGRQELEGELIEDVEGALWSYTTIEATRITDPQMITGLKRTMKRVAVAIDPATTSGPESDQTGIAAAGLGPDDHVYVYAGYGLNVTPDTWARSAIQLYLDLEADVITAESNQGGEMVRKVIKDTARAMGVDVNVRLVHAYRGKVIRAEPVSALWEQGRAHMLGTLKEMEDQLCVFPVAQDEYDDIVDALVHAVVAARGSGRRTGKMTGV
jgi:predicted phage terminase large subunit-like protein